jgi:hypothetical protein
MVLASSYHLFKLYFVNNVFLQIHTAKMFTPEITTLYFSY